MKPFLTYDKCRGLTLFKFRNFRLELWYCPAGYQIIEHTHPKEHIELIYLFGSCNFFRRNLYTKKVEDCKVGIKTMFKKFTVESFHSHWFTVGKWPLVFMNIQKFPKGVDAISASIDFNPTTEGGI